MHKRAGAVSSAAASPFTRRRAERGAKSRVEIGNVVKAAFKGDSAHGGAAFRQPGRCGRQPSVGDVLRRRFARDFAKCPGEAKFADAGDRRQPFKGAIIRKVFVYVLDRRHNAHRLALSRPAFWQAAPVGGQGCFDERDNFFKPFFRGRNKHARDRAENARRRCGRREQGGEGDPVRAYAGADGMNKRFIQKNDKPVIAVIRQMSAVKLLRAIGEDKRARYGDAGLRGALIFECAGENDSDCRLTVNPFAMKIIAMRPAAKTRQTVAVLFRRQAVGVGRDGGVAAPDAAVEIGRRKTGHNFHSERYAAARGRFYAMQGKIPQAYGSEK